MKHLNPRQGITTAIGVLTRPIFDFHGVKHLNPRQGITTHPESGGGPVGLGVCVKHLNPRQGITTQITTRKTLDVMNTFGCETPKSPPGDYNQFVNVELVG